MTNDESNSVAVVGASPNRAKFGNKAVRAFASSYWKVFPVNPAGGEIEGFPVYRSLGELPEPPLVVSVYLPPKAGLKLMEEVDPASEVWLNPGAESPDILARAAQRGLRVRRLCSILELGRSPAEFGDS